MKKIEELKKDTDGMETYDYLVNHVPDCVDEMDYITENLLRVDKSGQFLASSARYLSSVDRATFDKWISRLIEGAIERDRERRYIGSLLASVWGENYKENAEQLRKDDDNFRRIYKRIFEKEAEVTVKI